MNIPERTRFIGDEDPLQIWWFINGTLVDFSGSYTFVAKLAPVDDPDTSVFSKSTGFTGAAGTGTDVDGTPNLTVEFATSGELNAVDPGQYLFEIVATNTGDSTQNTLQMTLNMRSRLGAVGGTVASSADGVTRVYAFPFAFDTPGLIDGVSAYTPAVGDVLIAAWVGTDEVFDGTSPKCDFGTFVGTDEGVLNENEEWGQAQPLDIDPGIAGGILQTWAGRTFGVPPMDAIGSFISTDTVKVVVSQDGRAGGISPGSTRGSATLYLMVATPLT